MRSDSMLQPAPVGTAIARCAAILLIALVGAHCGGQAGDGDRVTITHSGDHFAIENRLIQARFSAAGGKISGFSITDRLHETELPIEEPFALLLKSGTVYNSGNMTIVGEPSQHELTPHPDASRAAERIHGEEIDVPLETSDHSLRATWSLVLLDGSS